MLATVTDSRSLGRPAVAEDPYADEYLAITFTVDELIKGSSPREVVLGWDAFGTDGTGRRVSRLLLNGVETPGHGDQLLLFLVPSDPGYDELLGGVPTHDPVALEGVMTVEEGRIVAGEPGSAVVESLTGVAVSEVGTRISD